MRNNMIMLFNKVKLKYMAIRKKYHVFFVVSFYILTFIWVSLMVLGLIYFLVWLVPTIYNWQVEDLKKMCYNYFDIFFNEIIGGSVRLFLMRHRKLFYGLYDEFFNIDDIQFKRTKPKNFRKSFREIFNLTRHKVFRRKWRFRDLVMRFDFFFNLRQRKSLRKLKVHVKNFFEERVHVYRFTYKRGLSLETVIRWWKRVRKNLLRRLLSRSVKEETAQTTSQKEKVKKPFHNPFVYKTLYGIYWEKLREEQKRWKEHFWSSLFTLIRVHMFMIIELSFRFLVIAFFMTLLAVLAVDYYARLETFGKPFSPPPPYPDPPEVIDARVKVYKDFIKQYYQSFNKPYKYRRPFTRNGKFLFFFKVKHHERPKPRKWFF